MLKGKHILLGITGSIAAYKAAALTRLLVKAGCEVQVVMTTLAKQFITPLTMATLSQRPILVEFFDPEIRTSNSVNGPTACSSPRPRPIRWQRWPMA